MWGRPQVDHFASHMNHQLPWYLFRTDHPFVVAFNTLSQSWTGLSLFIYPLIPLLEKTLFKISENQVEEVIIIALSWSR